MNLLLLLSAILAGFTGIGGGERAANAVQVEARAEAAVSIVAEAVEALSQPVFALECRAPDRVVVGVALADAVSPSRTLIRGERRQE